MVSQLDSKIVGADLEDESVDCFNGRSTVGTKYQKLERKPKEEEEKSEGWFPDEENLEMPETLDRLSATLFSGNGWITNAFRKIVSPSMKQIRRFNRKHRWLSSFIKFTLLASVLLVMADFYLTH